MGTEVSTHQHPNNHGEGASRSGSPELMNINTTFGPVGATKPSLAPVLIIPEMKEVKSEEDSSIDLDRWTEPDDTVLEEPDRIKEVPYLKNVICLRALNNNSKKKKNAKGRSSERVTSHEKRVGVTNHNLTNKIDINKDESAKEERSRPKTHLKPGNTLEKMKPDFERPNTERDIELITSSMNFAEPTLLEKIEFQNGTIYQGEWVAGKKEGKGVQYWLDGSRYQGTWKNGSAHGWGTLMHNDGEIYQGQWINDRAHGFGSYTSLNGSRYVGEWRNNMKHGMGIEKFYDGSEYEGEYKQGKIQGRGYIRFANGNFYQGEFLQNELHGKGKDCAYVGEYTWLEDKRYKGQWEKGKFNGQGTMVWKNGNKYSGFYKEDSKHGMGKFEWRNGCSYQGHWSEGLQHGQGVFTNQVGVTFHYEWFRGQPIKEMSKTLNQSTGSAK